MTAEVCADCGRMAEVACPWQAPTCGDCSAAREVYPRADLTACPAHGAYLPDTDGFAPVGEWLTDGDA